MDNLKKRKSKKQKDVKVVLEESSDSEDERQYVQDIAGNIINQIRQSRDKKPNPKVDYCLLQPPSLPSSKVCLPNSS